MFNLASSCHVVLLVLQKKVRDIVLEAAGAVSKVHISATLITPPDTQLASLLAAIQSCTLDLTGLNWAPNHQHPTLADHTATLCNFNSLITALVKNMTNIRRILDPLAATGSQTIAGPKQVPTLKNSDEAISDRIDCIETGRTGNQTEVGSSSDTGNTGSWMHDLRDTSQIQDEAGNNCKRLLLSLWDILVSFCRLLNVWQRLCPVEQDFSLEPLYPVLTELMASLVEMRAAELQSLKPSHAWMFTPSMKDLLVVLSLPTSCIQAISKGTKVQIKTAVDALPSGFIALLCCLVSGTLERKQNLQHGTKNAGSAGSPTQELPFGTMLSSAEAQKCTTTVAQAVVECALSGMGVVGNSMSL